MGLRLTLYRMAPDAFEDVEDGQRSFFNVVEEAAEEGTIEGALSPPTADYSRVRELGLEKAWDVALFLLSEERRQGRKSWEDGYTDLAAEAICGSRPVKAEHLIQRERFGDWQLRCTDPEHVSRVWSRLKTVSSAAFLHHLSSMRGATYGSGHFPDPDELAMEAKEAERRGFTERQQVERLENILANLQCFYREAARGPDAVVHWLF